MDQSSICFHFTWIGSSDNGNTRYWHLKNNHNQVYVWCCNYAKKLTVNKMPINKHEPLNIQFIDHALEQGLHPISRDKSSVPSSSSNTFYWTILVSTILLWASVYDVCFLWSYVIVFRMKVIQPFFFLVALVQAVCIIYLNKSLQTLLCNKHVFVLPLHICVE